MATNEVFYDGDHLSLNVGTGIRSNDPVRVGSINGVVQADDGVISGKRTGNEPGFATVKLNGLHNLTVVLAGTAAPGAPVYATVLGANKKATLTDTNTGVFFGCLPFGAASGTSVQPVLLSGPTKA